MQATMGTIPLDGTVVALLALTLLPMVVLAASAMFAIALKPAALRKRAHI
jgi:hypothetical protein